MTTRIDITLEDLHQLHERVGRRQLAAADWAVVGALVSMFIARTEARCKRLKAKAAQQETKQAASGQVDGVGSSPDADAEATDESSEAVLQSEPAPEGAAGPGEPALPAQPDPPKKGHGRNGADAFVNATKYVHGLAAGIV